MAKDMTQGSASKQIAMFSLPIMLGTLLQQLYNTADSVILGNFQSEAALSAVGSGQALTMFFVALAMGLSTGSGIVVAQYFGAKQTADMKRTGSTVIILILSVGILLSIAGVIFAKPFLQYVLNTPVSLLDDAVVYYRIYCMGVVFQFTYNIMAAILRSMGDSKATLYFLLATSVLNVVLDLLFVAVFKWSVAGAAIATVISQAVSAVLAVLYLFRNYPVFRYKREEFVFDTEKCKLALKMAIPTTIQQSIISFSHIALQRLINGYGENVIAGCTVGMRLENYIFIPISGFSAGLSTFTAQNIGAGKPERVKEGYKGSLIMSVLACVILVGAALLFAKPLVGLFGLVDISQEVGVAYLTGIAPFLIIFALYYVNVAVLQGSGDVVVCMFLTLCSLGVRVVITYLLASYTALGYTAIWWSLPICWTAVFIISLMRYKQGRWKKKGIVSAGIEEEQPVVSG